MKFGEQVDYGPENSLLNFGSDPEHILNVVTLPVGCKCLQCFDAVGWVARRASGL